MYIISHFYIAVISGSEDPCILRFNNKTIKTKTKKSALPKKFFRSDHLDFI